ncbi:MAG: ATP-dependent helicase RhlE [Oscillospiraceae bacterium]|nr:ATP-dependent helicase RhlE [Oscillospiraceae bacterium]
MNFSELGLLPQITAALESQGYETPTPIQRGAIPPALRGLDVLGCAQTGTGKTCAFSVPILQRLSASIPKPRHIRALVLTPTRELALQIQECFLAYGNLLSLRSAVIFGGVGQASQVNSIQAGLDILVATPGRLLDLQSQKLLDLSRIEIFVLDEADRMLDMGFIHDVRRILTVLPKQKQTLFFSATMSPEIMELVDSLLHSPVKVAVDPVSSPVEVIRQSVYFIDKVNKGRLLAELVSQPEVKNALVFSRTKHGANRIADELLRCGIAATAIHGNKSQTARQQALADFKLGRVKVLVATDIAARGIDIDELSHVFNYNLPEVPETYVHRIGRTGRAGHEGTAITFCDFGEKVYLKSIETLLGRALPVIEQHAYPMEVFEVEKKEPRVPRTPRAQTGRPSAKPAKQASERSKPAQQEPQPGARPQEKRQRQSRPKQAASQPSSLPNTEFSRPDPLSSDRVMDATARLLAPRAPSAAPAQKAASPAKHTTQRRTPAPGGERRQPAPVSAVKPQRRGSRPQGRGPSRAAAPQSSQKDSTEQESLMKPYYWNED